MCRVGLGPLGAVCMDLTHSKAQGECYLNPKHGEIRGRKPCGAPRRWKVIPLKDENGQLKSFMPRNAP